MAYKIGLDNFQPRQDYRAIYNRVMNSVDPMMVLEHYGARNVHQNKDELIHSCLIDQVHPHHSHGDESPSAALNVEKKLYGCHSYGGGDIVWLIQEMEGIDRPRALDFLSRFLIDTYQDSSKSMLEIVKKAFSRGEVPAQIPTYSTVILRPWRLLHPYMYQERGIDESTLVRYQVGYDEQEQKVVLPHFWKGKLVGFQKRRLDYPWVEFQDNREPKYKNSTDFPKENTLYNWDTVIARKEREVVVVESVMSVLKAESLGITNFLCTFGGKVTKAQAELLKEFDSVTLFMDNDASGWSGTIKLYNMLKSYVKVKVIDAPEGIDAGDFESLADLSSVLEQARIGQLVIKRFIDRIEGFKNEKVRQVRA